MKSSRRGEHWKHGVLVSARLRFSPATQELKTEAANRIVERAILAVEGTNGSTVHEIEQQVSECFGITSQLLPRPEVEKALRRLASSERVRLKSKGPDRYGLTPAASADLLKTQEVAEKRFLGIVERLFENADEPAESYALPFLDALCVVFAKLGEDYMDLLLGRNRNETPGSQIIIAEAAEQIASKAATHIDRATLASGLVRFFQESNPESAAVKWNMAQNYFIVRAFGIDDSSAMFSRQAFGDAEAYLDTNVVIHALEPRARYHRSFKALSEACRNAGMKLLLAQPTQDELRRVVDYKRETIPKVARQVPDETAPKVRGLFLKLFREELAEKGEVNLNTLFKSFRKPRSKLKRRFGVQFVDDAWFLDAENEKEVKIFSTAVRATSKKRRPFPKGKLSVLHDAVLLRWIDKERERTSKKVFLVTLDNSLRLVQSPNATPQSQPLALALDALLQWIWPAALRGNEETEVADIFSEALQYRLLPQETFFEERDFLMLDALQMQAKHLPAVEVEECIQYLKTHAAGLDPSNIRDREKLAHVLGGFFADPSRDHTRIVRAQREQIAALSRSVDKLEGEVAQLRKKATRRSLVWRVLAGLIPLLFLEALSVWLAVTHGEGATWPVRLGDLFYIPVLAFPVGIVFFLTIVGKDRLGSVPWLIRKILRTN